MKKRMLAVMLPVAAFVALAGTGFGVWVFNTTTAASKDASYNVANAVSVGALTLAPTTTGDDKIVLDGDTSKEDLTLSYNTTITASEVVGGGKTGGDAYAAWGNNDASTNDIDVTYNFKVELKGGLNDYLTATVACTTNSNFATSGTNYVEKYAGLKASDVKTETYTITLAWKTTGSNVKPTTLDAYNTMLEAMEAEGTGIYITASVVDAALAA
jgi:hypothetical protein